MGAMFDDSELSSSVVAPDGKRLLFSHAWLDCSVCTVELVIGLSTLSSAANSEVKGRDRLPHTLRRNTASLSESAAQMLVTRFSRNRSLTLFISFRLEHGVAATR